MNFPARLYFALGAAVFAGCAALPDEIGQIDTGSGSVRMAGSSAWKRAEQGSVVYPGDEFRTGPGEIMKIALSGVKLELYEGASLKMLAPATGEICRAEYSSGDLLAIVDSQFPAGGVALETAAGAVCIRTGAAYLRTSESIPSDRPADSFRAPPSRVQVIVIDGEAVVENNGKARKLVPGDSATLETGRTPGEIATIPPDVLAASRLALLHSLGRLSPVDSSGSTFFETPRDADRDPGQLQSQRPSGAGSDGEPDEHQSGDGYDPSGHGDGGDGGGGGDGGE